MSHIYVKGHVFGVGEEVEEKRNAKDEEEKVKKESQEKDEVKGDKKQGKTELWV